MTATVSPASRARTNAQIDAGPGSLSPGGQRLVLIGMIALCSLGAFEALAVATAMPTIAVDLDGLRHYTFAFAVVFATSVVGMLTAGRWCDRTGPTPAMWTGVALFVVGLVVAGTATGMGALIAGRAVQGVGSGLFGVALYVLVARVFVAERRPAVFSAFAAAWVVPAIVGPGLAGLVVDHLGWRWVFLGAAVLTVPAAILMRPGLTAARGEGRVSAEGVVSDGVVSDRVGLDGTGLDGAVLDGESNGGRDTDAGPEAEAGPVEWSIRTAARAPFPSEASSATGRTRGLPPRVTASRATHPGPVLTTARMLSPNGPWYRRCVWPCPCCVRDAGCRPSCRCGPWYRGPSRAPRCCSRCCSCTNGT